jgi:aspartate racemase
MRDMIGILGGMGPRATVKFLQEVVNNTEAEKDWDHVHTLVEFAVDIPSRGRHIMLNEESPVEGMKAACFRLMSAGCSKIFVPCNSAHFFYEEVVSGTNIPWVNMLKMVADKAKIYKKVLILGAYTTIIKKTYDKYLNNTCYLSDNNPVFDLIENVKVGKEILPELLKVKDLVEETTADCVVLACTELPIAVFNYRAITNNSMFPDKVIVDAGDLYVKELIKCGGCNVK